MVGLSKIAVFWRNYSRWLTFDGRDLANFGTPLMSEKLQRASSDKQRSATTRLKEFRSQERPVSPGRKIPIQLIANALVEAGYTSLDTQAKALGLRRSTAWTIMNTKHKLGCLNNKTARCILANDGTPLSVRAIVEAMLYPKD